MRRLFGLVLGLAVLVLLPFLLVGDAFEEWLSPDGAVRVLSAYGTWAWAAGAVLLVVDILLPVPGTVVMAALGALYGPVVGAAIASAGSVASGLVAYGLCLRYGQKVAARIAGEEELARGGRLFDRYGGWIVAGSRWLPVLPEVVACTAGLVGMRVSMFVAALASGVIPLSAAYATLGYLGRDAPVLTLCTSAALPIALWLLVRPLLRDRVAPGGG